MTEQQPPAPTQPKPEAPRPEQPAANGKQPPWGKPEDFNPEKAWELIQNLRSEKGAGNPDLERRLQEMQSAQEAQRTALAQALGVKPEEASDADKLAKQIEGLQGQILASERRALSATTGVPENLLANFTDAEAMRQHAEELVRFAEAAHAAAISSTPPPPAPAFQANPGQGQGNTPLTPEAAAAAEYEKYYPSSPAR